MIPNDIKNNMEDRVLSWFWVILFISAILFFKDLLTDMHVETLRIAEEREREIFLRPALIFLQTKRFTLPASS
jgi:hypothetical protein